jgi:hypothetical protein
MKRVDDQVSHSIPAVLIILYRRFNNIPEIIEVVAKAKVPRIYLAIDVPPLNLQTKEYSLERDKTLQYLRRSCQKHGIEIFLWIREENYGCARSVLSACQWFYNNEAFGVVLEDDCIPTLEFFDFVRDNQSLLEKHEEVFFICGTQHANVIDTSMEIAYLVTSYPFLWGWATSSKKWKAIIDVFLNQNNQIANSTVDYRETLYWRTGVRRAIQRRVDVWDTIIVGFMVMNKKRAILPRVNLIQNRGLDEFATNHYVGKNLKTWNIYLNSKNPWQELNNVDASIRDNFLKINRLMPVRNISRLILDSLMPSKQIPLSEKISQDFQRFPRDKTA